ncbi:ribonucleotide reductase N-terminal alpha domain-containing protein [Geoalkalibacter sp.]|uniref:ribonucleotide reductase N-terminal alpha domain-containing protein n=1 Tax=Geoalkalibacter sp. TaxID=3041440 RepID=UPI00272E284E|nr:ribonucleotide reductase N-terminal alpha domain-containing protein [Geoalkalibacter sp.]
MKKSKSSSSLSLTTNARTVLERRYLKRDAEGKVLETPEDMFRRVAKTIAAAETRFAKGQDPAALEEKFYRMMTALEFLPNSPTLMNAGRELGQLSACFVLPVGDSMESIFEAIKNTALIHKSGGGTGFSFSRIRPANDVVASTTGVSSGPLSFMKVFDAATETIKQGGTRRGANMGILRVDHPDIMDFIMCKRDQTVLTNFNISVGLTEAFMDAVEQDAEYELRNPRDGRVVKKLSARKVFEHIVELAWTNGEPGIIFLDRLNRDNPTPLVGEIESTNPCVTADTFVLTSEGPRQVRDLVGRPSALIIDGQAHATTAAGFFATGHKSVVRLSTREGQHLRLTADHLVLTAASLTRYRIEKRWVPAGELQAGDRILLHNHRPLSGWNGPGTLGEGYLLGLLVGDGTLKQDKAVLSAWKTRQAANGGNHPRGIDAVMATAETFAREMPHRSDFQGWQEIAERGEYRLSLASLKTLALNMGMAPGKKDITPTLEKTSSDFYRGFLSGLFDTDGSVQGSRQKGVSVRLAQSDLSRLEAVQRMLLRLGIVSTLYAARRCAGTTLLPDGKGGQRDYATKAQHELIISNDNLERFATLIGFRDTDKQQRLETLLTGYERRFNRERFVATVEQVLADGSEEVFDVQVPGINAFDANGLYVHNCGEQPLLPYESCNLGSINLATLVKEEEIDWEKLGETVDLAVRFLDNVIEVNKYPLALIDEMTRANRKIGLGVMGWADLLILLGIAYNSPQAVQLGEKVMKFINDRAHEASRDLAEERGAFPNFKGSIYDKPGLRPIRNATCTTIAPTGTISIIASSSSGIEPLFAVSYVRQVLDNDILVEVHPLFEKVAKQRGFYSPELMKLIAEHGTIQDIAQIPEDVRRIFVTAHDITPEDHIRMQAAFQKHTDNAVSKTVNFCNTATRDDVSTVYRLAYKSGCKGVTIYRDGSRDMQVLSVAKKEEKKEPEKVVPMESLKPGRKRERPRALRGATYQMETGCGPLYVTINEDNQGLFELFTTMGKAGGCAASQCEAIGRLVSLAWRSGVQARQAVKQMIGITCHKPAGFGDNRITSCADAVAKAIQMHMLQDGEKGLIVSNTGGACPECGGPVEHEGGCCVCHACGYSECA